MKKIDFPNGKFAIYDDEDEYIINSYKFTCQLNKKSNSYHVVTAINNKTISLSRILKKPKDNELIIFKNNETLDYRKSNLLVVTKSQNQARLCSKKPNSYKGVSLLPSKNYRADIKIKGKTFYLGTFEFAKDAVEAYNKKAKELYGELAYQNKIN